MVYSEPGKGTTFNVYLPVFEAPVPEQEEVQANEIDDLTGSETILLVEDDNQVRDMAAQMLKSANYSMIEAQTALEALTLLDQNKDAAILLLTDLVMPELSGKDLYTRAVTKRPDIKVIYMSGYTNNVITHHGVLDKGTNFIQKPFSHLDLLTKVREVLGN